MKASFVTLVAVALLGGTSCVLAASSVDLTVKGSVTPSACVPNLTQGGTVDYGKIPARDLSVDTPTEFAPVTLQLSIDCEAPTLFALNAKDNRFGSSLFPSLTWYYGLGYVNGTQKLGSYSLDLLNPVSDSAVFPIHSFDQGQSWSKFAGGMMRHTYWNSFSDTPGTGGPYFPKALRTVTADLQIITFVAPAKDLPLREEVPLDGSASLDLLYL
jgi:hypothetical protein